MPNPPEWQNIDQTPENPFDKSTDYEAFLNYLGALNRPLTVAMAHQPITVNLEELNNHPEYKEAAAGALQQWSAVTPLQFELVTSGEYLTVVSPEIGEEDDGSAYSAGRYVSVGQRFHDTEPHKTEPGGYLFNTFVHEFGHEWGLNHPGVYNYGGPGGEQITFLAGATWVYDQQRYSVMSYFDGIDVGERTRWTSTTPMVGDIEAVIRRYFSTVVDGVRTYEDIQLNTGDNVYGFGSTKLGYELTAAGPRHDVGFVIHDTGGYDTIDFSGSTADTILDLREGRWSSVNGHRNNVAIFDGHNADATQYYVEKGVGSRFDDIILGNDGDNELIGGAGDDKIAGFAGNDNINGGAGADILDGGTGDDTVNGGAGDDEMVGGDGADTLNGAGGNDKLDGGAGNDKLAGGAGDDLVIGGADDDTLTGGVGNDRMDGGDGADVVRGGDGDDMIAGGRDTLASRDINNTLPIPSLEDQTESNDGNDRLYGEAGNDTIEGGAGDDLLDGGTGDDILRGMAGVDVFRGGDGSDTVDYSKESPFQLLVNLELNIASGGTASGDTFYSIENLIGSDDRIDRFIGNAADNHFQGLGGGDVFNGGDGNDILDGARDADVLYGDAGDDTLIGGAGYDYIHGGDGNDTAVYTGSTRGVTVDLAQHLAAGGDAEGNTVNGVKGDTLISIENLVGSALNDNLFGDAGVNRLSGGAGDDVLGGGAGQDYLDGGAGSDMVAFYDSTQGVVLALGQAGEDTLVSIEGIAGSAFADTLTGDAGDNSLVGQGGDDTLAGGAGNDVLDGDFVPFPVSGIGMGDGYVTLPASATNNSTATAVDFTNDFSLAADAEIRDAATVPHWTVNATGNGSSGFYKVVLKAGSTITADIDGIADPDQLDSWIQLIGGDGTVLADNDDNGGDPGSSSGRDSGLTFTVEEDGTYYIQVGSWVPGSDGFQPVVGSGIAYELNVSVAPPAPVMPHIGIAGNDTLDGGEGNDTLYGRAGNDTLNGGLGQDYLDGGAGTDRMVGGDGGDTYAVDTSSDIVVEARTGTGIDLVNSSASFSLGGQFIENLTLTGAANINGTGNSLANAITGNGGTNTLRGLGGNDTLTGAGGNDTLAGGDGNDTFLFADDFGLDTITDFVAGSVDDVIGFATDLFEDFASVLAAATQVGSNTVITYDDDNTLTLRNVAVANLQQSDFLFAAA
jgi:Ca2+-binding RTX toxin-like protein